MSLSDNVDATSTVMSLRMYVDMDIHRAVYFSSNPLPVLVRSRVTGDVWALISSPSVGPFRRQVNALILPTRLILPSNRVERYRCTTSSLGTYLYCYYTDEPTR
jgi:hypothetical protein